MPLPERFTPEELERIRLRLAGLRRRELPAEEVSSRSAAVLVSLCHHEGNAAVLFTKRSDRVGTHKGHVSFPGGMTDETDEDPRHTALRELEEELGIARHSVSVLGLFHDAKAITGVRVVPVVGFLGEVDPQALVVSEAEIDQVFLLTLEDLVDPRNRYEQMLSTRGPFPVFDAGPFPVWGLTAWILSEVLAELFDVTLTPGKG